MGKLKVEDLWNLDNLNMKRTKEEMRIDGPKGADSIIPVEIWDVRE